MRRTAHGSGLGRWRWVVERTFAWLNQFRRLRVRYDKRADIHEAFLSLGCALICWQSLRKRWAASLRGCPFSLQQGGNVATIALDSHVPVRWHAPWTVRNPLCPGAGGMGEVYRARDTKLNREIALKILPPELADSELGRARFEREARAIAALNHPNIVTVHSVEAVDGVHFITMELVKGATLAALLPRQGFALERFFDIAVALADAVAAAHAQGIVHRDLKPGNVMVDLDGRVKVLDFGLAQASDRLAGAGAASNLLTAAQTEQGVIVGTCKYMSPEQARGDTIDARSDIFSLGIVFYEMLTGRPPFEGPTPSDVSPRSSRMSRRQFPRFVRGFLASYRG